jgi:hypothetical protein
MLSNPWFLGVVFSDDDAKCVEKDFATCKGFGSVENKPVLIGFVRYRPGLKAVAYIDLKEGAMYYRQSQGLIHADRRPFLS